MRITKLDPFIDDHKSKNRTLSNSREKGLTILARKKLIENVFGSVEKDQDKVSTEKQLLQDKRQNDSKNKREDDTKNQNIGKINDAFDNLRMSKKALTGETLVKDPKDTFMDFLQTQMKNQVKQLPHLNKNKLKLPQINGPKNQTLTLINIAQDQMTLVNKTQNQKVQGLKNNQKPQNNTLKSPQNSYPIFINIKAVAPIQKQIISKKKDFSLRDLKVLRRERSQQNEDYIIQTEKGQTDDNSQRKVNTLILRKNNTKKVSQRQSPMLKLGTGEKKRSQQNSLQKASSILNNRQKRIFSINKNIKKYATTYHQFCTFVSSLNKIRLSQSQFVLYKAFVGKGNNSILIKNVIKNRFWWNIMPEKPKEDVNLVWSQQRDNQFINDLPSTQFQSIKQNNLLLQNGLKKHKYHLQAKEQKEKQQPATRQFTRYGFARLLSEKQLKQNNFTQFYAEIISSQSLSELVDPQKSRIHNHLEFNWNLTNKKALFYNLKTYYQLTKDDPFKYIPLTFHIKQPGDQSWQQFKKVYEQKVQERLNDASAKESKQTKKKKKENKKQKANLPLWIIKPGQNTNQGCGIQVSDSLDEIEEIVKEKSQNGKNRSSIIQRYLMPFLYNKRKFDIRCYMLATSTKGTLKGYWYEEGYIRTSSKQFTTKNLKNRMIHLTNDAVQKKGEDYGKYENGNKISFADFQKYLDNLQGDKKLNFYKTVYPKMMRLARDALTATNLVLDSKNREFTFEVFGLDFMIDEQFETWLIEVNNNPCLQLSSPLLARIIPNMIENAFKIAVDPLFPPPLNIPKSKSIQSELFESNKFTLIFNSGDIEEGFQHSITENKVNLDKIIEGEEEDEELMDDEDENCGMQTQQNENLVKENSQKREDNSSATMQLSHKSDA